MGPPHLEHYSQYLGSLPHTRAIGVRRFRICRLPLEAAFIDTFAEIAKAIIPLQCGDLGTRTRAGAWFAGWARRLVEVRDLVIGAANTRCSQLLSQRAVGPCTDAGLLV